MPNPVELTHELFQMIIDYTIDDKDDVESFCKFCLVNRRWYAVTSPRLYSGWNYDGETHSFISLWKFCRTMLENVQIAKYVRALNIAYWGYHSSLHSSDGSSFPRQDFAIVEDAASKAGMQELLPEIIDSLLVNDRRPLMALLLTTLPNLRSIYAHVPEKDPYLAEVFRLSLSDPNQGPHRQALQKLEKAELMSEWHVPQEVHDETGDDFLLGLQYLWPIFRLPNLRELSVFDFESKDASVHFKDYGRTSSITHLTLVNHKDSYISALDVWSLITLPKALVSLTIYLNDYCQFPERQSKQISNEEIWLPLETHQESIECLDFYRDCIGVPPRMYRKDNSQFGSLRSFKRLNRLYIQPDTLLGGRNEDSVALFRLKDALPSRLKTLVFYGDEGLLCNETLGNQISEVLESLDFVALSSLVLEDVRHLNDDRTHPFALSYQEVRRVCREKKVNYRKVKGRKGSRKDTSKTLPKGGSESRCFRKAWEMQLEKLKSWTRKEELERSKERREEREWRKKYYENGGEESLWPISMVSTSESEEVTSEEAESDDLDSEEDSDEGMEGT